MSEPTENVTDPPRSEDSIAGAGAPQNAPTVGGPGPGPSSGDTAWAGSPTGSTATRGLLRLWIKVAGWFVSSLGFLTIIAALKFAGGYNAPFLITIGFILMGCSYAIAGQAFAEGRAWPIPLAVLACITSTVFSAGLSLLVMIAVILLCIAALSEGALEQEVGGRSKIAFGLWLGGVVAMLLQWVLSM